MSLADGTGVLDLSANNPPILVSRRTAKLSKTFGATGQSDWIYLYGRHEVSLTAFGVATVKLERSLDGGTTPIDVTLPDGATANAYSAEAGFEIDAGVQGMLVRFNCTAWTSGSIVCKIF